MIENPYELLSVFLGLVLLSVWLDSRFKWASKISPVVMILFFAGLVSNIGLITDRSAFYDQVAGFTVPFAVCLILFTVNLKDLRRFGVTLLAAFRVACIGTIIGVLTAGLLLNTELVKVLGAESWKLAGPFTGTYTGGSLNFFAMWNGLEIGNPDLFAAANAVDNLAIFPLFMVWVFAPALLGKFYPLSPFWGVIETDAEAAEIETKKPELRICLDDAPKGR